MDFNFSQEQQLLKDSVERFIQDNYGLEARQESIVSKAGYSEAHWNTFAELGWLALPFDEADGGIGGGPIETMIVMEAFGRGMVIEPFFATVVLAGGVLKQAASEAQKQALVPGIIDGSRRMALAYAETQSRYDLNDVATSARADGGDFLISGSKAVVLNGQDADSLIVLARTSGNQLEREGLSLFLVDPASTGVKIDAYPTVDGGRAAEIHLDNVRVGEDALIGVKDQAWAVIERVIEDATLAISAEAVGAMEVLYKDTVAYTQEREQFDHPLSDFQVLQHRMVEMFMETEQARSLLYRATLEQAQELEDAKRDIHALKHLVGKSGINIAENAVQLHGGMGMTEELRVGHYLKRMLVIDASFGNADFHLQAFTAS